MTGAETLTRAWVTVDWFGRLAWWTRQPENGDAVELVYSADGRQVWEAQVAWVVQHLRPATDGYLLLDAATRLAVRVVAAGYRAEFSSDPRVRTARAYLDAQAREWVAARRVPWGDAAYARWKEARDDAGAARGALTRELDPARAGQGRRDPS